MWWFVAVSFAADPQQECTSGNGQACHDVARDLLATGDPSAVDWLQRGCDAGDQASCSNLGLVLADGRLVPADRDRAQALLQKGCSELDTPACRGLAILYSDGLPPKDHAKDAAILFERACNQHDDLPSCAFLGVIAETKRDMPDAIHYLTVACDGGVLYGCSRLAALGLVPGNQAASSPAITQLHQLCAQGEPFACDTLTRSNQALPKPVNK